MRKVILSGMLVTTLTVGAVANAAVTDDSLTTKGYVDDGLEYVYGVASSAATTASNAATSASQAQTAAQAAAQAAQAAAEAVPEYVEGSGITITDGTGGNAGKKVLSVDVVTDWDTDKPQWAGGGSGGGSGSGE